MRRLDLLRAKVRVAYGGRCGYCGVHEEDAGAALTLDHYQPQSRDGSDELDNLVYCCPACNVFKANYWRPGSERRVLHPLRDDLTAHIVEAADHRLIGLTETGLFHIDTLKLNRPELVASRRRAAALARERTDLERIRQRFAQLEQEARQVENRIKHVADADTSN